MLCRFSVLLLALSLCLPAIAQAPTPQPERRTIAVSVLDKDGKAVHGLTAENFRGEFRGQPVRILSATEDSSPRRIAMLVDTSAGTPRVQTRWDFVWAAAENLIAEFVPLHRLSISTFADVLIHHSDFTDDRALLVDTLKQIKAQKPRSASGVYDALIWASNSFPDTRTGDAICVVTDGDDNASIAALGRFGDIEESLAGSGVRVFAVWTNPTRLRASSKQIARGKNRLTRVAGVTGGLLLEPRDYQPQNVAAQLAPAYQAIQHIYLLEAEFPGSIDKPREWCLEVVATGGKDVGGVQIVYPRLLVPLSEKK